jgi:hypothetical protein
MGKINPNEIDFLEEKQYLFKIFLHLMIIYFNYIL